MKRIPGSFGGLPIASGFFSGTLRKRIKTISFDGYVKTSIVLYLGFTRLVFVRSDIAGRIPGPERTLVGLLIATENIPTVSTKSVTKLERVKQNCLAS